MIVQDKTSLKIGLGAFLCSLEIAAFHAPGTWATLTSTAEGLYRAIHPLTMMSLAYFFTVSGFLLWGKVTDLHSYFQIVIYHRLKAVA